MCVCCVIGPGVDSTLPALVSKTASHAEETHGRPAPKHGKSGPLLETGGVVCGIL